MYVGQWLFMEWTCKAVGLKRGPTTVLIDESTGFGDRNPNLVQKLRHPSVRKGDWFKPPKEIKVSWIEM